MTTKQQIVSINNTIATAEMLAEQHVAYTEQFVTRANEELYKILSGMMALCVEIQASNLREKIIKQMRDTLREKYSVKTQKNSRLSSIVVKYVVRTGRKTAHVYGRVIQTAIDAGITAEQLPTYVSDNGGIDAIRKKGVDAAAKARTKNLFEQMKPNFAFELNPAVSPSLGTVQFASNKPLYLRGDRNAEYQILLCRPNAKGETHVVAVLSPSIMLEDMLIKDYYSYCYVAAQRDSKSNIELGKYKFDLDDLDFWAKANNLTTADAKQLVANLRRSQSELDEAISQFMENYAKQRAESESSTVSKLKLAA